VDWKTFAWIKRGKRRKDLLILLSNSEKPLSPSDIKEKLNISLPQVSLLIKEFHEKNLIKCLNPADKIGKIYLISKEGEKIINEL